MFWTVVIALCITGLIIIAVMLSIGDRSTRSGREVAQFLRYAFVVTFVLTLLAILSGTFTHVRATEVGVPVSFGKVGDPLAPGVHFTAPWVSVETYPTRPLNVDVTAKVRTADAGQVTVATTARWNVSVARARELYFQTRTGDEERISKEIVSRNLSQAIGETYNKVSNIDATKREGRAEAIRERLTALTSQYGIDIAVVNVRGIDPDDTTARAIADFAAQIRRTQIAEEANRTAQKEAARRLTEAKGLKDAAAQIPKITGAQAQALCVQAWERMVSAGHDLYASPCSGTGAVPTVNAR